MKNLCLIGIFTLFLIISTNLYSQIEKNLCKWKTKEYTLYLLSEGQTYANKSILLDANDSILGKYSDKNSIPNSLNAFLVTMNNGTKILIDAGFGRELFNHLNNIKIKPEEIDFILLTHLHSDHISGLFKEGIAAFPNAKLYISQKEFDYWKEKNNSLSNELFEKYESKINRFEPKEIDATNHDIIIKSLPELKAISSYGHTPGHTMYQFSTTEDTLLIWGDLTHAMSVQMPYPEIAVTYDVDPDMAITTRKKILKNIADKNIVIAGMHIASPAIGKIKKLEQGYAFKKEEISY